MKTMTVQEVEVANNQTASVSDVNQEPVPIEANGEEVNVEV